MRVGAEEENNEKGGKSRGTRWGGGPQGRARLAAATESFPDGHDTWKPWVEGKKKGMTNDETREMKKGVPNLCKLMVGPRHPGNRLTTLLLRRR